MSIAFAQPLWFVLVLLIFPLGWLAIRWCVAMARIRRWTAVAARLVLLSLLAAMLAGASSTRETSRVAVIGVVDVSESVRRFGSLGMDGQGRPIGIVDAAAQFFRRLDAGRGPEDLLGVVVFAGDAVAAVMPTPANVQDRDLDIRLTDGTDIAGAIRLASAMIPPDATGRLVLISDGNETSGDAIATAEELASSKTGELSGIDVIPVDYSIAEETLIESVIAPANAPPASTVTVRVVIVSVTGTTGTLSLTLEGEPVDLNGPNPGTGRR
ncbi:MAG TPA: VWA domain-containing protein, partial [Phycisphaerales bacterium]|nr:VWA domain-containing protein [Phycisphaerales bacterium]